MTSAWWRSSVGKKAVMGATGLVLVGFILMHLLGNMLIFLGPDALNGYAEKLRHLGAMIWVVRGSLLAITVVHVRMAITLTRENRAARPVPYAVTKPIDTTLAARTMMLSGLFLLAYLVYHLLHFTFGVTQPAIAHLEDPFGRHDVYRMVVLGFQDPRVVLLYVAAMGLLCMHLSHGIASMFQSVGLNDERTLPALQKLGRLLAMAIFIGYVSIPLSIALGLVGGAR